MRLPTKQILLELGLSERSNDYQFMHRVYQHGITPYSNRLLQYGFKNNRLVLDAGCGFGQWAIALSGLSSHVECLDLDRVRVNVLDKILELNEILNINAQLGKLEALPYASEGFDLIFCYSAIHYSETTCVAREFFRTAKSGGLVYICSNGLGWYLSNIAENRKKTIDYDPFRDALKTLNRTFQFYENDHSSDNHPKIISSSKLNAIMASVGFELIYTGPEGSYSLNGFLDTIHRPFFIGSFHGIEAVYESVFRKP